MSEVPSPSRESADRIGHHIKESFFNYLDHWQEWIIPTLVATIIAIVSFFCCCVPYFFVLGPVSCGLYLCALTALRGCPVELADLNRGWKKAGSSMMAWFFISLGSALPIIVFYGFFIAIVTIIAVLIPSGTLDAEMDNIGRDQATVESPNDLVDRADGSERDAAEEPEEPGLSEEEQPSHVPGPQGRYGRSLQGPKEPPPFEVFIIVISVFAFYAMLFLAILVCWLWTMWFTTRTMFVLPLIADRRLGFIAALRESWGETRNRFWELLLINFVAGVIASIGIYAMYIGILFTIPIGFTIIASVYAERFPTKDESGNP